MSVFIFFMKSGSGTGKQIFISYVILHYNATDFMQSLSTVVSAIMAVPESVPVKPYSMSVLLWDQT